MNRLQKLLTQFKNLNVVVLGDFVADAFVYGEISRISREAPVLVLQHRQTQIVPGGGANAVHNLRTLGANPFPVGLVGDDAEGRHLLDFFRSLGIHTRGIRVAKSYRTPTKTRILAGAVHSHRQQIVRIDSGGPEDNNNEHAALERNLKSLLPRASALVVSDYGYGSVTPELVKGVSRSKLRSTVDSRFNIRSFVGMSAATPNESEVESALGIVIGNDMEKLEWAGRKLLRELRHEAVLITRGRDGMALFERSRKTEHIPIFGSDEIADVTGAGDTVIATFTLALAAGGSFRDAARLANLAGGIVVMKHGTRPVLFEELMEAAK